MNREISIKRMVSMSDAELLQLAQVYAACFNGAPWFEEWTEEQARRVLEEAQRSSDVFVATEGSGNAIALGVGLPLASYKDAAALVERGVPETAYWYADWATHPQHQARGYGTKVLRCAVQHAQQLGFHCVSTRTRVDNVQAIRIFERCGFSRLCEYEAETGGKLSRRVVLVTSI